MGKYIKSLSILPYELNTIRKKKKKVKKKTGLVPDLYNRTDRFHLIGYTNSSYLSFLLGLSSFQLGLSLLERRKRIKFIRQWIRYDPPASDKAFRSALFLPHPRTLPCNYISNDPRSHSFHHHLHHPRRFPKTPGAESARFFSGYNLRSIPVMARLGGVVTMFW